MPRLLVVRNDPTDPPALLGLWWERAGLELVEVRADAGDPVPDRVPDDVDGVVSLGGSMSAHDDHVAAWLPAERALLADAVGRGIPTLGVCLGGQLMTAALGGVVRPTATPEVGLVELDLAAAAADDPLFAVLSPGAPVAQFHGDEMAVLPEGAVVLASTADCAHQAWRYGEHAWAVQFHPEVDPDIVESWTVDDPEPVLRCGATPADVVAGLRDRQADVEAAWEPFARAFADVVRSRSVALSAPGR